MNKADNPREDLEQYYTHMAAEKLYELRRNLGLKLAELAKITNVSIQQYQKYEKGINRITLAKIIIICKRLHVPLDYFYPASEKDKKKHNTIEEMIKYLNALHNEDIENLSAIVKYFSYEKDKRKKKTIRNLTRHLAG